MTSAHVLYNPLAGGGTGESEAKKLSALWRETRLTYCDMTQIESYAAFFDALLADEAVVIAGGDGTLNRFVNDTDGMELPRELYYFAAGSGNDFWHDLGRRKGDAPVRVGEYLRDLPTVEVNGVRRRFLNGIGYGIDGYCCEEGDRQRQTSEKPVNYTSIAVRGLLFHFRPVNAEITVDGVTHRFGRVWLAPTMNGRFYGGGMMPTPAQERLSEDGRLTTMVMYGSGKLRTLMIFPSIFKGEHVAHTDSVQLLTGYDITVSFDRPTALQIDGETVPGVTRCRMISARAVRENGTAGEKNIAYA